MTDLPDEGFSADVVRLPRNWLPSILGSVGALAFVLLADVVGWSLSSSYPIVLLCMIAPSVIPKIQARWWPGRPCRATASAEGLKVDGSLVIPHAKITQAYVRLADDRATVVIDRKRAFTSEFSTDPASANGLVKALGFDVTRHIATFRGQPPANARLFKALRMANIFVVVGIIAVAGFVKALPFTAFIGGVALFFALLSAIMVPSRLHVGVDGILRTWLGTSRFVAFKDVASVAPEHFTLPRGRPGTRASVVMKDGTNHLFQASVSNDVGKDAALVHRIQEAFEAYRNRDLSIDPAATLARQGRPVAEWVADVRARATAEGNYRVAAVPRDRLHGVLADPTADPTVRAGAAVALASGADDGWQEVVLRGAKASAEPRVRVALETVAKSENEEEWLASLEALRENECK